MSFVSNMIDESRQINKINSSVKRKQVHFKNVPIEIAAINQLSTDESDTHRSMIKNLNYKNTFPIVESNMNQPRVDVSHPNQLMQVDSNNKDLNNNEIRPSTYDSDNITRDSYNQYTSRLIGTCIINNSKIKWFNNTGADISIINETAAN